MKFKLVNIPLVFDNCQSAVKTTLIDNNGDGKPEETVRLLDFREVVAVGGGIALAIALVAYGQIEEAMAIGTTVIGYGIGRSVP